VLVLRELDIGNSILSIPPSSPPVQKYESFDYYFQIVSYLENQLHGYELIVLIKKVNY